MHGRNELCEKLTSRLVDAGLEYKRCRGSHLIYSDGTQTVSVPRILNKMIYKRLLKETGLEA